MRTRLLAVAGVSALVLPGLARGTSMTTDSVKQTNGTPQTNFEYVFQGDVTSAFTGAKYLNPFANGTQSVTFDGTNTILKFSGTNSIANGTTVQFGYQVSQNLKVLNEYWTPAKTALPALSASVKGGTTGTIKYEIVFATVSGSNGSVGQWSEMPYQSGKTPTLTLTNNSSSTIASSPDNAATGHSAA
jgi:hypothetical protein